MEFWDETPKVRHLVDREWVGGATPLMLEHHTILPGNIVHVPGRLGDRKPQDMKNRFIPGLTQLPQVTTVFVTNPQSDVAVVGPVGKHQVSVGIDPDRGNIPEIPLTVGDN